MAQRKTVTVLFSDVVGSTTLGESVDPEVLRSIIGRYFEEARRALERHGGTLEKFIGDAVVALFGAPISHEDDALRALRAAEEIRGRLALLNEELDERYGVRIEVRMGVNTGEVVVEDAARDGLRASGDTMNTAARLEQAAPPGEIFVGALTRQLGGAAIDVEPVEPIDAKGKAWPVEAFRLVRVLPHAEPYDRRDDTPLVGRDAELEALRAALEPALAGETCRLATVVGPAGVGKTRLARELAASLGDRVRVLVGRCVPYGEGITFLPIVEALRGVETPPDVDDDVAARVAALVRGEGAGTTDEAFLAIRRFLEALAHEQPLVLVVDDAHWAEPTLLDLLEYLVTFSTGAPLVLLVTARAELLEERPTWTAPQENATVVVLGPLSEEDSVALADALRGSGLAGADLRQVIDAADGNPLFLEQLIALNADGDGELVVPPTIQALLTARIDRLPDDERRVLQHAAVEGRVFERANVLRLLPEDARDAAGAHLLALARRQFVRPVRGAGPDDAFAFVHGLMRDAAYHAIPKAMRAELHARLASLLEARTDVRAEHVGFHLADAVRYRRELGLDDDSTRAAAARATGLLGAAGKQALSGGDDRAAMKLLERASELAGSEGHDALSLQLDLARAYEGSGLLERARALVDDVRAAAARNGDRALASRAEIEGLSIRTRTDSGITMSEVLSATEPTIPVFERVDDESSLASAWRMRHWALFRTGRYEDSLTAAWRSLEHARRAGARREQLLAFGAIVMATLLGRTPVEAGLRLCDDVVEQAGGAPLADAYAARVRGCLLSMIGEFERGREECRRSVAMYEELGMRISALGVSCEAAEVERRAGALAEAERMLDEARAQLLAIGDVGYVGWVGAMLARVLADRGAYGAARSAASACREHLQRDHAFGHAATRLAEGIAALGEGAVEEADICATEALERASPTDMIDVQGDIWLLRAEVELARGRERSAGDAAARGVALYESKGDLVSAARARAVLSSSGAA